MDLSYKYLSHNSRFTYKPEMARVNVTSSLPFTQITTVCWGLHRLHSLLISSLFSLYFSHNSRFTYKPEMARVHVTPSLLFTQITTVCWGLHRLHILLISSQYSLYSSHNSRFHSNRKWLG